MDSRIAKLHASLDGANKVALIALLQRKQPRQIALAFQLARPILGGCCGCSAVLVR